MCRVFRGTEIVQKQQQSYIRKRRAQKKAVSGSASIEPVVHRAHLQGFSDYQHKILALKTATGAVAPTLKHANHERVATLRRCWGWGQLGRAKVIMKSSSDDEYLETLVVDAPCVKRLTLVFAST
ncbi:hypothetical protein T439DRAFT_374302 [Meredithblackwellia eburnea MCA 4105]